MVGATSDLKRVVFVMQYQVLVPGAPAQAIYASDGTTTELLSVLPDGTASPGAWPAGFGFERGLNDPRTDGSFVAHGGRHPLSEDARRVYFSGDPDVAGIPRSTSVTEHDAPGVGVPARQRRETMYRATSSPPRPTATSPTSSVLPSSPTRFARRWHLPLRSRYPDADPADPGAGGRRSPRARTDGLAPGQRDRVKERVGHLLHLAEGPGGRRPARCVQRLRVARRDGAVHRGPEPR